MFCSPACSKSAAESQAGESVAVPVSPRRVLPRPPPPAAASAGESALDEATRLQMDEHRAKYAAVKRSLNKAAATCAKVGASFSAASRLPPPPIGAGLQVATVATLGVTPEASPEILAATLCAIGVASSVARRAQLKAAIQSVVGGPQARSSALVQPQGAASYVAGLSADAKLALRAALEADQAAAEASAAVVEAEAQRAVPAALLTGDFGASLLRLDASFKEELGRAEAVREQLCQKVNEWDAELAVPATDHSAVRQRAVELLKEFDTQAALVRAKYDAWLNWTSRKPRPSQKDAVVELWVATSAAQALCREFVKGAGSLLPGSPKAAAAKGKAGRAGKKRRGEAEAVAGEEGVAAAAKGEAARAGKKRRREAEAAKEKPKPKRRSRNNRQRNITWADFAEAEKASDE